MIDSRNGIIGFAIGDALGVPAEFKSREELLKYPITDMVGYGTYNLPMGTWSDDTSMTLATIDSIMEKNTIDVDDMANKFLSWYRNSNYTATGRCFDIGQTTLQSLIKFERQQKNASNCGGKSEFDNGNGSLMRILPIAYYAYHKKMSDEELLEAVYKVSAITHAHEVSIIGCYIYCKYAIYLLKGNNLKKALELIKNDDYSMFEKENMDRYNRILKNNIEDYTLNEIRASGYVVHTLESAIWCLLNNKNYNDTIIKAINLGEDTDTVGAVVGGLAGIYYGIDNIKDSWKNDLINYDYIEKLCKKFNKIINF